MYEYATGGIPGFIYTAVITIIYLIPLLIVIYKFGRRDQVMDELVKDVNGIGKKLGDIREDHTRILDELRKQITSMNEQLIKTITIMEFIKDEIEKIKKGREK